MDDKVIVTHRDALKAKYGTKGFAKITAALNTLKAADWKRGLRTRVVHLDDKDEMKGLAKPLVDITDYRAAKEAIDGVFKKLDPDYLMILGAPDVVPHQDLKNPALKLPEDEGDDDDAAWGDLPYACDTPYNRDRDPARFVGPTRVVGRLPDLTGASEPSHLLALLKTAATWKGRDVRHYRKHFGLTTFTWQESTRHSLDRIFGADLKMSISPPAGPGFRRGELGAAMHFINCHGGVTEPEFYGEKGRQQPPSLTTRHAARAIRNGTVASVECCYGGELYDSIMLGKDIPICQSYLRQGAYGYLGSTNVAYGCDGKEFPPNGAADLLCQFFLRYVLDGASTGRAMLMARQRFAEQCSQADPIDLKTMAQFCLFGDPSVHPVSRPIGAEPSKGIEKKSADRFARRERRAKLKETGDFLTKTKPTVSKREKGARISAGAKPTLAKIAKDAGLPRGQKFVAYKVKGATKVRSSDAKASGVPSRYYLAIAKPRAKGKKKYRVVVVAKEKNGQVVGFRVYHEK